MPAQITPAIKAAITANVQAALSEDLGSDHAGDWPEADRTALLIPADRQAMATVMAREAGVLAGAPWFDAVFAALSADISITWHVQDGERFPAETLLCELRGPARALLSGERAALNLLQTLSAVARNTQGYVTLIEGTDTRLLDTRKTLPGLRIAQKYAVTCGGGHNHRIGLYDAILIKENHIAAAGSIGAAVEQAQISSPGLKVEVEVENMDETRQALEAGADILLLDNFSLAMLREAVALNQKRGDARTLLEASGGVNRDTIRSIAKTGVDFVSVGALTKDIQALDLSMRFQMSS